MKKFIITALFALVLVGCKTDHAISHCPVGVQTKDMSSDMRAEVSQTCFTEDSKKITASGWSRVPHIWHHTDLLIYIYPQKNLFGGDANLNNVPNVYNYFKHVQIWENGTNVRFFTTRNKEKADVVLGFDCVGNWCRIGRGAKMVDKKYQTINLDWNSSTSTFEYMRSTCHETGHMLGLGHEHQNPVGGIQWDEEAVYKYYEMSQGWTREQVKMNLLDHYAGTDEIINTGFDPESVMLYPIPASITKDRFSSNLALLPSKKDFETVNKMYPKWVSKDGRQKIKLTDYKSRLID